MKICASSAKSFATNAQMKQVLSLFNLVVKAAEVGQFHAIFLIKLTWKSEFNFADSVQTLQVFFAQL